MTLLESLRALVLAIFTSLHPAPLPADAQPIASAIAQAVLEDRDRTPVLGSHEEDAALLAVVVWEESRIALEPHPYSWDSKAHRSCGAFQEQCATMPGTLVGQARKALWLLHWGSIRCRNSPAAPYLGGCETGAARRQGDARVAKARELLRAYVAERESDARLAFAGVIF